MKAPDSASGDRSGKVDLGTMLNEDADAAFRDHMYRSFMALAQSVAESVTLKRLIPVRCFSDIVLHPGNREGHVFCLLEVVASPFIVFALYRFDCSFGLIAGSTGLGCLFGPCWIFLSRRVAC